MESIAGTIIVTDKLEVGDLVQDIRRIKDSYTVLFRATQEDADRTPAPNRLYIKLILNEEFCPPIVSDEERVLYLQSLKNKLI